MIAQVTDTEIDEFLDQIDDKEKRFEKKKIKVLRSRHNLQKTAPSIYALLGLDEDTDKAIAAHILSDEESQQKNSKKSTKTTKKAKTAKKKNKKKGKNVAFKQSKAATKAGSNNKKSKASKAKKKTKNVNDGINLSLLKKQAQIELTKLADSNDQIFMEKERLRLKYDDLAQEMKELKESMTDGMRYKEEMERMKELIEKYKSETNALQTEIIMLRQVVYENQNQNDDQSEENEQRKINLEQDKMDAVKQLVKEKNDILTAFDDTKFLLDQTKNELIANQKELNEATEENTRLRQQLDEQTSRYLQEKERNELREDELNRQLNASKNELLEEYEKKVRTHTNPYSKIDFYSSVAQRSNNLSKPWRNS